MKKQLILLLIISLILSAAGCRRQSGEPFTAQLTQLPENYPATDGARRQAPDPAGRTDSRHLKFNSRQTQGYTGMITEDPDSGDPLAASSLELKTTGRMPYYLYTPEDPKDNMPLIIYLHGSSLRLADDAALLLTNEGFPLYLQRGYFGDLRAYVAIPKIDENYRDWSDAAEQISELIAVIHRDCGIDTDNVALTGHSLGGSGTWQLAIRLPGTFARIAPVSGGVAASDSNLAALAKTRVWAFVGTADTVVDPQMSRDLVSGLKELGADARITELQGATHRESSKQAYCETGMMQWLVSGE